MTEGAKCGCKSGLSWELGTTGQFLVDTGHLLIPGMAVWRMCHRCVAMHLLRVGRRREGDGERVPVLWIAGSSMQGVRAMYVDLLWHRASVSGVWVCLLRTLPVDLIRQRNTFFIYTKLCPK